VRFLARPASKPDGRSRIRPPGFCPRLALMRFVCPGHALPLMPLHTGGPGASCPGSLRLDGAQILAQIADSEQSLVRMLHVHSTKHRTPHRHLRVSMRGQLGAVLQYCGDVARRVLAAVVSRNGRKVGRFLLQRRCDRAIAAPIGAMARGAIVRVHLSPVYGTGLLNRDNHFGVVLIPISRTGISRICVSGRNRHCSGHCDD